MSLQEMRGQQPQVAGPNDFSGQFRVPPQFGGDILENLGQGVYCVDVQGRFLYVNREFERLLGWKRQEVLGADAAKLTSAPGYVHIANKVVQRLALKEAWTGQFPVLRANGEVLWTLITATPILDKYQDMIATCCTIVELKRFLSSPGETTALAISGFRSTPTLPTRGSPRLQALPQRPGEHLLAAAIEEDPQAEAAGVWGFVKDVWGKLRGGASQSSEAADDPDFQREIETVSRKTGNIGPPSPRGPTLRRDPSGESEGPSSSSRVERSFWAERVDLSHLKEQYRQMRTTVEGRQMSRSGSLRRGLERRTSGEEFGEGFVADSREAGLREEVAKVRVVAAEAGREVAVREGFAGGYREGFREGFRESFRESNGGGLGRGSGDSWSKADAPTAPPRNPRLSRQGSGFSSQESSLGTESTGMGSAAGTASQQRMSSDVEREAGLAVFQGFENDLAWPQAPRVSGQLARDVVRWDRVKKPGGQLSRQASSTVGSETEDEFHSLDEEDATWRQEVDAVAEEDPTDVGGFADALERDAREHDKGAFGSAILDYAPGEGGYDEVRALLRKSSSEKSSESDLDAKEGGGREEGKELKAKPS